jgi:hypothetical protein
MTSAINIIVKQDAALVSFPKALFPTFKKAFPSARFDWDKKTWTIPGVRAPKRAADWKAEMDAAAAAIANEQKTEAEKVVAEAAAAGGTLADRKGDLPKGVVAGQMTARYAFSYVASAVAVARSLPGAKFDAATKAWTFRASSISDIDAIITGCNRISSIVTADHDAAVARRQQQESERAAAKAAVAASRYIELVNRTPALGKPIKVDGSVIVPTSVGKSWRSDESMSSIGYSLDYDLAVVCYVYYRAATADEIAAIEAEESAAQRAAEIRRDQKAAVAQVSRGDAHDNGGQMPIGEVIYVDRYVGGLEYSVILTADGWLWHVTHDGTDGGSWGEYNCGYCRHGVRIRATDDIVRNIKSAG